MRQYQVPQFINIEDKVVGPLTLKQFFFLLGGVAAGAIGYFLLPFFLFIIVVLPVGLLTLAITFVTINGQPFSKILFSGINFYLKPKLFVWKTFRMKQKKYLA